MYEATYAYTHDDFELIWREDVDPIFGRLICWMSFSAGAEFLAKGVCLLNGVDFRTTKTVPQNPTAPLSSWIAQFCQKWDAKGTTQQVTDFGTLENIINPPRGKTKADAPLWQLCMQVNATQDEKRLLFVSLEYLARRIRNRDAHAYVPNTRDSHFGQVPISL